ncbi:chitobiase/beta-hexosaminidase C-terminal domain-containing protein [Acidicapsa ligni]|uniref:chitobiase/beta-hexosaminidase C-terminal domain-containing protein n=1 Tax=Acidicapsa ligni TaxID=542300 RepID=UPI0021E07F05|nr:chitobiase/beta-hexosaminidase C-terminal domain-containing protein [Acidicapsa ligni]
MSIKCVVSRVVVGVSLIPLFLASLLLSGCGGSSMPAGGVPTPSFAPAGGTYNSSQAVTISDTTQNAVLYCTTDGSTPTTSSPRCAQPTTVYQTEFLQAIAVVPGKTTSNVAAAAYTINLNTVATPSFTPAGGAYTGPQQVTIADATAGANVYYTTDGSTPTASSQLYMNTTPIQVSKSETINAIAVAAGYSNSGVVSATYSINQAVAAPVFSVGTGSYTSAQMVTITDQTAGAVIYYSLNGTASTASSVYSGPVTIAKTATLSAIAVVNGTSSPVTLAAYAITMNAPVPAPAFFPASGASFQVGQQSITISDVDTSAVIHYTIDGSAVSSSSPTYSAPISLTTPGTITVQAIAVDANEGNSAAAMATYTVTAAAVVPPPAFSPASGSAVTVGQTVQLADSDANAVIHVTTDGTPPTANSPAYSAPIALNVAGSITIQAIAIDNGSTSTVATASYDVAPAGAGLTGKVLSGTTPIKGASVQLYSAGSTGYGSSGTAIGASVSTDATGAFMLNYGTCPASPNDLFYLVATGGDTGSGANSSIALMTALGPCSALSTSGVSVVINEATTAASAYALSAFMTTAPNVGTSATNYQGLSNSFATVNNLVNTAAGTVLTITPAYASNPVPLLNSSTVPQARIDTLADILASCTASSGGGACSALFSAATPSGGMAPGDTLQAILDVAQNPGLNVSTLFGLASATGPFQPELAVAPNDWTIALTYTGAGLGLSPTTLASYSSGGNDYTDLGPIINTGMAIDALGNIWVTAFGEDGQAGLPSPRPQDAVHAILARFDALGAPVTPATTLSTDATPQITFGGYDPEPGSPVALIGAIAFDASDNAWLGDLNPSASGQSSLLAVGQTGSVILPPAQNVSSVTGLALDSVGNIWATSVNGIFEYTYNSSNQSLSQILSNNPGFTSQTGDLTFDSNGIPWVTQIDANSIQPRLFALDPATGNVVYDPFNSVPGYFVTSLIADGSGGIYGCDPTGLNLDVLNYNSNSNPPAGSILFMYPITDTGRGCGNSSAGGWMVLDGQGHIFVLDANSGLGVMTLDEYTTGGALISPAANGYTGTSAGEGLTLHLDGNYFPQTNTPIGAMDGSGNLWVMNYDTSGLDANFNVIPGNVLVEFVGIGAPVVTPTSVALKNGQLGARP